MTNQQQRKAVSDAYDGKAWKDKVKKMPDQQIVALYLNFKKRGLVK